MSIFNAHTNFTHIFRAGGQISQNKKPKKRIFLLFQSATSQSKHAARFLRLAMASIMDILKIKPFVEVSVGQLLWGYEDPLLKLAKDVVPKEQKLPYEEFGLMYNVSLAAQHSMEQATKVADFSRKTALPKTR